MHPDQTEDTKPTFSTAPGIVSTNGIYAYECGDDAGDHKSLKGASLEGEMGWDWDQALTGHEDEEAAAIEAEANHG